MQTDIRNALSEQHKTQFDILLVARKQRDEAVRAADAQYRAKLQEALFGNAPAKGDLLRGLPRNESQIIERLAQADKALRDKYQIVLAKFKQPDKQMPAGLDRKAQQEWRQEQERLAKDAQAQALFEARQILKPEQLVAVSQAVEAQKTWSDATAVAEADYARQVAAVVPRDTKGRRENK